MILYSAVGFFMFFIPVTLREKTTIPLDHIISFIRHNLPGASAYYAMAVLGLGAAEPFLRKTWNKDVTSVIFSILKICGFIVSIFYFLNLAPKFLMVKDMLPFLFDDLVVPVGIIVPVGAIFLAFLVDFGLLELIGVLMQPIMKPLWKTPGRSAIDAVASFVGSYSIGLLITNRVYKEGKYTVKEAAIIATGFSTVSATFMVIVAKTCGVMDIWNIYFWSTLLVTFTVTALTVRIYPLSRKPQTRVKAPPREISREGHIFKRAFKAGLNGFLAAPTLKASVYDNLRDGLLMAMRILPSIMSIGLIGLLLAKYTVLFDVLGYLFWPFIKLMHLPDGMLAGKAAAVGIAEMFLPSLLIGGASFITRFSIAVTSVSSILFFSASIPCILSTEIPIDVREIVLVWFERTALSLMLSAALAWLLL